MAKLKDTEIEGLLSLYDGGGGKIENVYEYITTLKEVQDELKRVQEDLVAVKSLYVGEVVWTNPNPFATFASQTVSVDMSKYTYCSIIYNNWDNYFKTERTPIGQGITLMAVSAAASGHTAMVRSVTTGSTGFTFKNAITNDSTGSNTKANNYLIPYQIIGYK